jgi:hypothetical protein
MGTIAADLSVRHAICAHLIRVNSKEQAHFVFLRFNDLEYLFLPRTARLARETRRSAAQQLPIVHASCVVFLAKNIQT